MGIVITYNREEAVKYIIDRSRTMARLGAMDNGIPPPTDEEMALAVEDAFNFINSFPPQTSLTPEDVVNDNKQYITLVCLGTLKFTFDMLIAYISANLMDVVIDEFAISSRLQEYTHLSNMYGQQLEQKLNSEKLHMGTVIRGAHRKTSLLEFGWIRNTSIANRYLQIYANRGRF